MKVSSSKGLHTINFIQCFSITRQPTMENVEKKLNWIYGTLWASIHCNRSSKCINYFKRGVGISNGFSIILDKPSGHTMSAIQSQENLKWIFSRSLIILYEIYAAVVAVVATFTENFFAIAVDFNQMLDNYFVEWLQFFSTSVTTVTILHFFL